MEPEELDKSLHVKNACCRPRQQQPFVSSAIYSERLETMKNLRLIAALLLLSFTAMVTGCGSGNDEQVFTNASHSVDSGGPTNGYFLGRVLLDDFEQGAAITITDLNGNTLYNLTTESDGCFHERGPLPADFRIEARMPGDPMVYAREIRGGYDGLTMYINPLSTLISHLMREGGTDMATAEARVKAFFSVPPNYPIDWLTNAKASPFSSAAFQQRAREHGDISGFYDQIAGQIPGQISGQVAGQVRAQAAPPVPQGSLVGKFFTSCLGDVRCTTVGAIASAGFGALTHKLGLNLGTGNELKAISAQLSQVLQDLSKIEGQIATSTSEELYGQDIDSVTPYLNDISQRNQNIVDFVNDVQGVTYQSLLGSITAGGIQTDITNINGYLFGSPNDNIVFTYAKKRSGEVLEISGDELDTYMGYPVRFNSLTADLQGQLDYIVNHYLLAGNVAAEAANLAFPQAPALAQAEADMNTLLSLSHQALAQVPQPFTSDNVLHDRTNGLMWYKNFHEQQKYADATSYLASFTEGGLGEWRLATRDELENFISNRIGVLVDDTGSDADWIAAFEAYDFDLTHYKENTYVKAGAGKGNTDPQGQSYFDINSDSGDNNQNVYQWWGVKSTPATTYYYDKNSPPPNDNDTDGSMSAYIFVREAGSSEQHSGGNPLAYGLQNSSALNVGPDPYNWPRALLAQTQLRYLPNTTDIVDLTESVNVTSLGYWTTDNPILTINSIGPANLEDGSIANIPARPSQLYQGPSTPGFFEWHPPLTGTAPAFVNATCVAWFPASDGSNGIGSASGSYRVPVPPNLGPPVPVSAQVVPYNSTFDLTTATLPANPHFAVTIFYKDGQYFGPTSAQLVYDLLDPQGQVVNSTVYGFIAQGTPSTNPLTDPKNELVLSKQMPPGAYTVRITCQAPVGGTATTAIVGTAPVNITNIASNL